MDTVALTLAKINAKALFKTLADMVAVVKFKKLADKLANLKAKELVDLLANALAVIEVQTLGYTCLLYTSDAADE